MKPTGPGPRSSSSLSRSELTATAGALDQLGTRDAQRVRATLMVLPEYLEMDRKLMVGMPFPPGEQERVRERVDRLRRHQPDE